MKTIKLISLDLDGTLFNNKSIITPKCKQAIKKATEQGVKVVISTGRPYSGLPFEQIEGLGINYAITTNGAGVYEIPSKKEIHMDCMDNDISFPIIDFLLTKRVHMDAFVDGDAISPSKCLDTAKKLCVPASIKEYIINSRTRIDDIKEYMIVNNAPLQKMTVNFQTDENGVLIDREDVRLFLTSNPDITVVCGGYNNLEFTRKGVDKGQGLIHLANYLGIPIEETMAIGDTENDLEILKTAGISVAMGNSIEDIKKLADYVTLTNEEDGVAHAIEHFLEF